MMIYFGIAGVKKRLGKFIGVFTLRYDEDSDDYCDPDQISRAELIQLLEANKSCEFHTLKRVGDRWRVKEGVLLQHTDMGKVIVTESNLTEEEYLGVKYEIV